MTKRMIEHEVKLETSVKVILAALAFGVLAHAFVPAFSVTSAFAKKHISGKPFTVRLAGPVRLSGKLGLGGKLNLGGAVKCDGCVSK